MTAFWYVITILGIIVAIVNFSAAAVRRKQPMVALVRGLAGIVSLAFAIGIVVGKAQHLRPPFPLDAKVVFIITGVFIFAVLWLPSYMEKSNTAEEEKVTLQQRAARPANATIRLKNTSTDEWVN